MRACTWCVHALSLTSMRVRVGIWYKVFSLHSVCACVHFLYPLCVFLCALGACMHLLRACLHFLSLLCVCVCAVGVCVCVNFLSRVCARSFCPQSVCVCVHLVMCAHLSPLSVCACVNCPSPVCVRSLSAQSVCALGGVHIHSPLFVFDV